jgi:hypothetical protein
MPPEWLSGHHFRGCALGAKRGYHQLRRRLPKRLQPGVMEGNPTYRSVSSSLGTEHDFSWNGLGVLIRSGDANPLSRQTAKITCALRLPFLIGPELPLPEI